MKSKILGFLEGVTGAISGHLPGGRNRKKPAPHKTIGARKHSANKTRTDKKLKTRRFKISNESQWAFKEKTESSPSSHGQIKSNSTCSDYRLLLPDMRTRGDAIFDA